MSKHNILLVDDEPSVLSSLKRVFIDEPYTIFTAQSAKEGLKVLSEKKIKLVISDEQMPSMSGSEFLSIVRKDFPGAIRIMLTGHASIGAAMRAINEGEIYRFFTKPWDDINLLFAVKDALEKYDLEEENRRLLKTVKRQTIEIKSLEKQFPGISEVRRDEKGNIIVDNLTNDEMSAIIEECEKKYK
ncbi:MAG: response regulator [Nitrospirae bacterium]|nr:MAG: response regulator [Nitrospirota bacterium]